MTVSRDRDSFEYLDVSVSADVTLLAQPVEVAVVARRPAEADWQAATWIGDPGTTRTARVEPFRGDPGLFAVFVRVTDDPEIPVVRAGSIFFR